MLESQPEGSDDAPLRGPPDVARPRAIEPLARDRVAESWLLTAPPGSRRRSPKTAETRQRPPRSPRAAAAANDLRHAVGAHRDAVEGVGRLHRSLLVRDHHELRPVGVAAVAPRSDRCSCRRGGLDLVEEIERARPGEEEREGNEIAPSAFSPPDRSESRVTLLPAGRSSTSIPGCSSSASGSTSRSRPSPPGNSVDATSRKCDSTEAYVSANRRVTVSSSSRAASRAPPGSLRDRRAGSRARRAAPSRRRTPASRAVHLPEREPPPLQPLDPFGERVAVVALGRLRVGCSSRRSLRPRRPRPGRARPRRRSRAPPPRRPAPSSTSCAPSVRSPRRAPARGASRRRRVRASAPRVAARLDRALERGDGAIGEARKARGDDRIESPGRQRVECPARLRRRRLRLGARAGRATDLCSSSSTDPVSRARASSSSSTASAASPANQSSPSPGRIRSPPGDGALLCASSSSFATTRASRNGSGDG